MFRPKGEERIDAMRAEGKINKNNHKAQKNLKTEISTGDEDIQRIALRRNERIEGKWPRICQGFCYAFRAEQNHEVSYRRYGSPDGDPGF